MPSGSIRHGLTVASMLQFLKMVKDGRHGQAVANRRGGQAVASRRGVKLRKGESPSSRGEGAIYPVAPLIFS